MTAILRSVELLLCLFLVAWTVVFPLATLLSLMITLPLALIVAPRLVPARSAGHRR